MRHDVPHWGTPGEGSPPKNVPLGRFSPFLRFFGENFVLCEERQGLCPLTPPPFEKGGRKLSFFFIMCY